MAGWSSEFPDLSAWMPPVPGHPLRKWIEKFESTGDPGSYGARILAPFDQMIREITGAGPARLPTMRSDFAAVRTEDDLLAVRAEMVVAARLARHQIAFDFGRRQGNTDPDLLPRGMQIGVEIKTRRVDGISELHDELEAALDGIAAPVHAEISFDHRPLVVKAAERDRIVAAVLERCARAEWGAVRFELDQPWTSSQTVAISVMLLPLEPALPGSRVAIDEAGLELTAHLDDAGQAVLAVLDDPQKQRQARSRPTLLIVDAARVGTAWIRPPRIWVGPLEAGLAERPETPFIGVGMMTQTLDSVEFPVAVTLRPNAPAAQLDEVRTLLTGIGLSAH